MVDRVKPLKLESPDTGGVETDEFPTSVDPHEDYLDCAGVAFQDATSADDTTLAWRTGNDLKFKDGNNPTGLTLSQLSGVAALHAAYFDVTLPPAHDSVLATVSGLPSAPARAVGFSVVEQDVVAQSGLVYGIHVVQLTADGFICELRIEEDEWWPGPGDLVVRVSYLWSDT